MKQRKIAGVGLDKIHTFGPGIETYANTRLATLGDGVERGMRVVEMRSGAGLDLDVTIDRSGDIGRLSSNGQTLSLHPSGGLAAPWLMDREGDQGQGFLRGGYGGFLNTCGLDHIRQPERDTAERTNQDGLAQIDHPLHGKGTCHPAVLRGHGLVDDVPEPYVYCETEFVQAMSFVSALRLRRRIEIAVGTQSIKLRDTVRNVGSNPATHMLLYHFNLGFPMVGPGTTLALGDDRCVWRSEPHDPVAPFPPPAPNAGNMLSVYEHVSTTGQITMTNPQTGLQLDISYPSEQLPYCQMLKVAEKGLYCMGIEPCTTAERTRADARQSGGMIILSPGEERHYDLDINLTRPEN